MPCFGTFHKDGNSEWRVEGGGSCAGAMVETCCNVTLLIKVVVICLSDITLR
jgi:hypothetical protein